MRLRGTLLLAMWLVAGCGTTPYDLYLEAHPGWQADAFPSLGIDLEETVASVHAPPPRRQKNKLMAQHKVDIHRTNSDPWSTLLMSDVQGVPAPEDYLVVVHSSCNYASDNYWHSQSTHSWYVLTKGKLTAFGHWELGELCTTQLQLGGVEDVPLPVRHHLEREGLLSSTLPSE